MQRIEGAYSLVVMSPRKLIAARDPHGFRPLCIGLLDGDCYVFASETCALDALGAKFIRDVEPGEVCVVENGEAALDALRRPGARPPACVFEPIIRRPTPSSAQRVGRACPSGGRSIYPLSIRQRGRRYQRA